MKDYEQKWEEVWKEICTNADGSINLDQIKRELYDFSIVMHNVSQVYDHITGGRISKPNTDAGAVVQVADEYYDELHANYEY